MDASPIKQLWMHRHPTKTRTHEFKARIELKYHLHFETYDHLRQWSISNINSFWEEVWHFTGIKASEPFTEAVDQDAPMFPRPAFFQGARLNFAENLLYPKCNPNEDSLAVIEANESVRNYVTWRELRERAREISVALRNLGIKTGDCVAGYVANHCNALLAMLATTSLGAIWTAISPDTGAHAVLDRIRQIQPVVLFADNAVIYNGKVHEVHDKLKDIAQELSQLRACVVFETVPGHDINLLDISVAHGKACSHAEFVQSAADRAELEFTQLKPDHPVYILYSSGTTGKPKCIVHGAIGTLIQHKKEHDIQCDIRPGDRLFYFTTCTWMMWHWLVSGLGTGATLVLYDGSPFRPLDAKGSGNLAMPRLIEELGITHFGTSAKYLSVLEQNNVMANQEVDLKTLKAIYSTGSPLAPSTFEFVYKAFGPDINLGSITGGTDIISLFGPPSQISPVFAGEIQVRGLGMAVEAWDFEGKNVTDSGEPGDLVCVKAFPCQPIMFWGADGQNVYRKSYFEVFPGVWHHGDFVRVNPQTGGLIMLGRSDGVLKPAGVRFGSSEIYNVILEHFSEIEDGLCIGKRRENDIDETVVLFLKMAQGSSFSEELQEKVKSVIRKELSARHVPGIVDECPEIPVTINGKKVEVAVKQILCGTNVKTSASVANADCLDCNTYIRNDYPSNNDPCCKGRCEIVRAILIGIGRGIMVNHIIGNDQGRHHQRTPTIPFARSTRQKPRRWPLALRFIKGAIHGAIILPVTLHGLFAALIVFLDQHVNGSLGLPASIIPSLSIVVGLMLVFRNQTSYNRFWDGRNYLTVIITSIRNLTRSFLACNAVAPNATQTLADRADTERVIRILIAILYATKNHLRAEWGAEIIPGTALNENTGSATHIPEYSELLPQGLTGLDDRGVGLPLQLTFFVEQYIKKSFDKGIFHGPQASQLQVQLNTLTDAYGRMETIRLTSIPVAHLIPQKQVLALFGGVLPFALCDDMLWWAVPIVVLVMFTLYGIDGIGMQLEDPFGYDRNDIKMDAIVEDIRSEIMVLLEEWKRVSQSGGEMFVGKRGQQKRSFRDGVQES